MAVGGIFTSCSRDVPLRFLPKNLVMIHFDLRLDGMSSARL
jgi:hypothetical protein